MADEAAGGPEGPVAVRGSALREVGHRRGDVGRDAGARPGGHVGGEGRGVVFGDAREVGGHRRHHHRVALELGGVDVLEVVARGVDVLVGPVGEARAGNARPGAGLKAW